MLLQRAKFEMQRGGDLNSSPVFHIGSLSCSNSGSKFGGTYITGICFHVLSLDRRFLRSVHASFLFTYTVFIVKHVV